MGPFLPLRTKNAREFWDPFFLLKQKNAREFWKISPLNQKIQLQVFTQFTNGRKIKHKMLITSVFLSWRVSRREGEREGGEEKYDVKENR